MIQHLVTTSEELSDDKTGPAGNRTNYTNLHETYTEQIGQILQRLEALEN